MTLLPYTIGYEMTALWSRYKESSTRRHCVDETTQYMNNAASTFIALKLKKRYGAKTYQLKPYTDGHCIEFPSPVFKSRQEAVKFYRYLSKLFSDFDYVPQHPDKTVCGGHHWHIGLPDDHSAGSVMLKKLMRDIALRPYITWAFTHPDDTESTNNLHTECRDISLVAFCEAEPSWQHNLNNLTSKYCCIAWNEKGNTAEFRCFEAPWDYDDFLSQMDFVLAYWDYVQSRPVPEPITCFTYDEIQDITLADAKEHFLKLLTTLQLDHARYYNFIERNLETRWQLGRSRT